MVPLPPLKGSEEWAPGLYKVHKGYVKGSEVCTLWLVGIYKG